MAGAEARWNRWVKLRPVFVPVQQWAEVRGWTYRRDDPTFVDRSSRHPFGRGWDRAVDDLVFGMHGGRWAASCHYRYTTGARWDKKSQRSYSFHVMVLELDGPLPDLELVPHTLGNRITRMFGGEDLEMGVRDFDRRWQVRATYPAFAAEVLSPSLMERLLQPDAAVAMRFDGTDLICWATGHQDVTVLDHRLALMDEVVRSVPAAVWRRYEDDPYGPVDEADPYGPAPNGDDPFGPVDGADPYGPAPGGTS